MNDAPNRLRASRSVACKKIQQRHQVDPVALGSALPPIHLDAGGIDYKILDTVGDQEPVKPLGVSTWYTGAALRNVKLRRLAPQAAPIAE